MDFIDLYDRGSKWAKEKIAGASDQLDASTPCEKWDVRAVINHLLEGQEYFQASARREQGSLNPDKPPSLFKADPAKAFEKARKQTLKTFKEPKVLEKTGPLLGIAFTDSLIHGWDIAKATGQDTTMPRDLAESAFEMVNGRFTDENRQGIFKPEVRVSKDATAQEKLLAYSGRKP